MKKKIVMSIIFALSLSTMLLPWFEGAKGIQEIYGTILLENPIAFTCIILVFVGIWEGSRTGEIIGTIGMLGIIVMEVYEFFTWHILTITGKFSLSLSLDMCYPEFYFAVFSMFITFMLYRHDCKRRFDRFNQYD